ncbi:ATPase [Microlunatus endophyticus]|uniref:ATPase n=1 Tax=Microlunatus endophyticus TaxID=1716077 RepID=A0A917SJK9_9ACTN|nr:ATP-binding protein [Microlunatus endophyticus]GGL83375.1 ATPase [Microlunatus endophyticus]
MQHELNPYTPGSGLAPPALVGRDAEIVAFDQLRIRVRKQVPTVGRPLILSGFRGVGKTALLNQLRNLADQHDWLTIALEAQTTGEGRASVRTQLGRELTAAIRRFSVKNRVGDAAQRLLAMVGDFSISVAGIEVARNQPAGEIRRAASGSLDIDVQELVDDISDEVAAKQRGFAIFVDEMQDLDDDLLAALITAQHRSQQRTAPFYLVGAGLPSLPSTLTASRSYAERLFNYRRIGPLDHQTAAQALVEPARRMGADYSSEALDLLIEASHGYPYFLQEYGASIWDLAAVSTFTVSDAKAAIEVGQAQLDAGFYPGRWDRATGTERRYMIAMAGLPDPEPMTRAIADHLETTLSSVSGIRDELIKKGLIYSPERGRVAFTVPGMSEYIRRQTDPENPGHAGRPRHAGP